MRHYRPVDVFLAVASIVVRSTRPGARLICLRPNPQLQLAGAKRPGARPALLADGGSRGHSTRS